MPGANNENDHTNEHSHTCRYEGGAPSNAIVQCSAKEITDKGADINAHIKNIVAFIFLMLMFRGRINIAKQRGNIWFEKTVADNYQCHRYIKHVDAVNAHQAI